MQELLLYTGKNISTPSCPHGELTDHDVATCKT